MLFDLTEKTNWINEPCKTIQLQYTEESNSRIGISQPKRLEKFCLSKISLTIKFTYSWRAGSVAKSAYYSSRRPEFDLRTHIW